MIRKNPNTPAERAIIRQLQKSLRPPDWEPAPPYPGIKPGGIADRALKALRNRGPQPEDPAATRRSAEYWASYRKCAACPGPNRRQARYAFGAGTNVGHNVDGEVT